MLDYFTRRKQESVYNERPRTTSRHNPAHRQGLREQMSNVSAELLIQMPDGQSINAVIDQAAMIIGRSKLVNITLDTPVVSRQHARLERIENDFWLTDLGSTNGTVVNDQKISTVRLRDGDVITIGNDSEYPVMLVFRVQELEQPSYLN